MKNLRSLLLLSTILVTAPAIGDSYRVSSIDDAGKSTEDKARNTAICRDYVANLNTFDQSKPMICERKLNPTFTQFRRPSWRKWGEEEIWSRRSLIIQSRKYDLPLTRNISAAEWDAHIKQLISERTSTIHEASDVTMGAVASRWLKIQTSWPKQAKPDKRWPWKWEWQGCTGGSLVLLTADGNDRISGQGDLPGYWDYLIYRDHVGKEITVGEYWLDSWQEAKQTLRLAETCDIEYRQPKKGARK